MYFRLHFTIVIWICSTSIALSASAAQLREQDFRSCVSIFRKIPHPLPLAQIESLCRNASVDPSCRSVLGMPIFHWDHRSPSIQAKRVLVLGLIHGDEPLSGTLVNLWLKRLSGIQPKNNWRLIPVANPDGFERHTRINAHGVDLNRNFPTQDWPFLARKAWQETTRGNPRRYPGPKAGSEPETQCILEQIREFQPDLVVSVHSPYGLLDFDGPQGARLPKLPNLPYRPLGSFPGSLGRLLWADHATPVLTIELQDEAHFFSWAEGERLQDLLSRLATDNQAEHSRL